VHPASIFREIKLEAVSVSETSDYFNEATWFDIPEGCNIHIRRCENLKYHVSLLTISYDVV
jgi:hypothetical protein